MRRMKEEVTLTFSVLKWIIYATVAGLVVGTATFMFIKLLNLSIINTNNLPSLLEKDWQGSSAGEFGTTPHIAGVRSFS